MTETRVVSGARCAAKNERAAREEEQRSVRAKVVENCFVAKGVPASQLGQLGSEQC